MLIYVEGPGWLYSISWNPSVENIDASRKTKRHRSKKERFDYPPQFMDSALVETALAREVESHSVNVWL